MVRKLPPMGVPLRVPKMKHRILTLSDVETFRSHSSRKNTSTEEIRKSNHHYSTAMLVGKS